MLFDNLGNTIYQETDLFDLIYNGRIDLLDKLLVENTKQIQEFKQSSQTDVTVFTPIDLDQATFDSLCQSDWFIPEEYKNIDIEAFLVNQCPKENCQRLIEELEEFRARNMLPLLKVLKYLVDTFQKNNIVWGVGRGSSVASYALFLLGIHKIDSIKYNLDWHEFLR